MKWLEKFLSQQGEISTTHAEIIHRIETKKAQLDEVRPIPSYLLNKLKEQIHIEWSYNSNAIEGNTLTLSETRIVLEQGMTVKGKSFKEHLEISNHHDAIEYVSQLAAKNESLSNYTIRSIHELVLLKIDKEFAGTYRTGSVRITGAKFQPPEANEIQALMTELLDFIENNPKQLSTLLLSVLLHHRFVWIHPFFDGNGRTGRLLLNLFLLKNGFPPAVILKADRQKYYTALRKADAGDYNKLALLLFQSIERTFDLYLSAISSEFGYYKPIDDIVKEESVPYGQEYISLLARKGKINAYKDNGVWFTTKEAVSEYVVGRKRKRTDLKYES